MLRPGWPGTVTAMTTSTTVKILAAAAGVFGLVVGGCATDSGSAPTTARTGQDIQSLAQRDTVPAPAPAPRPEQPRLLAPVAFQHTELDADDQRGDGAKLVIEETELPKPGQVAVFDQDGKLLGATAVQPGSQRNVQVSLEPKLGNGTHALRAVLFVDDGDGRFDAQKDAPVREADDADDDDHDHDIEDEGLRYTVG